MQIPGFHFHTIISFDYIFPLEEVREVRRENSKTKWVVYIVRLLGGQCPLDSVWICFDGELERLFIKKPRGNNPMNLSPKRSYQNHLDTSLLNFSASMYLGYFTAYTFCL